MSAAPSVRVDGLGGLESGGRVLAGGCPQFSLKAGRSKTVVLKLSKASKKLLAAKRSLKVQIAITLASAGHRRTVLHRTTTLHRKG
jgi:hypothetical protein